MNAKDRRKLRRRKRRIARRLDRNNFPEKPGPVFRARNIRYEVSDRTSATSAGGVGAAHALARRVGLTKAIDKKLHLLKRHAPYHESDHVLNIAYNVLAGNTRLEDLELLRQDESYMDMLGAERIPDPTTAGDFLRRFTPEEVEVLMDVVNEIRVKIWKEQPRESRKCARIDLDGTMSPTTGEKKRGMGMNHKGVWGYHPLLVSLANTREPLFIVNRPGNVVSHEGAVKWIDKAIDLALAAFDEILLRGDTDFSLTWKFDEWTDRGVGFAFGYDACKNLVEKAEGLPDSAYTPLARPAKHEVATRPREKRENTKEGIVKEKGYKNIRLESEQVAEFPYRPTKCKYTYRMVVVRKNLTVEKGEIRLFDEVRYFFYITNDPRMSQEEVVHEANERCDQENLIEQLKNGLGALRVPVYDLVSNWAYMVIASLAWTLKAWFGLTLPRAADRKEVIRMEFKRFLNTVVRIPCQVVRTARRTVVRILAYTERVRLLFESLEATARLAASAGFDTS